MYSRVCGKLHDFIQGKAASNIHRCHEFCTAVACRMPLALPLMVKMIQPLFHHASAVAASVQWLKESLQQLKVWLKDEDDPLTHSNGATMHSNENCMV